MHGQQNIKISLRNSEHGLITGIHKLHASPQAVVWSAEQLPNTISPD